MALPAPVELALQRPAGEAILDAGWAETATEESSSAVCRQLDGPLDSRP
jgi:hypothetical protein